MISKLLLILSLLNVESASYHHEDPRKLEINLNKQQIKDLHCLIQEEELTEIFLDVFNYHLHFIRFNFEERNLTMCFRF